MASYLLSISSNGPLETTGDLPAPTGYYVEWAQSDTPPDGLELWSIDLQIAGAVADWAKGASYDAFWTFLESALERLESRPRGALTIKSRVDPHRVAATFGYLGPHQVTRARDDLRSRIAGAVDARSGRMKSDVELTAHD